MAALTFSKVTTTPTTGTGNVVSFHTNADANYVDIYITSSDGSAIRRTMRKADVQALIDASVAAISIGWTEITGKPATFTPSAHSHTISDTTGLQTALDGKAAASHTHTIANITGLQAAIDLKSALASPTFTGIPSAPTAAPGTNSTQIATTAFVKVAVDGVLASAPAALDTLNELAAALGNDANFATSVTNSLALKAPLASPAFTGNPTATTQTAGNNSTRLATTDFVQAAVSVAGGGDMTKSVYDTNNNGRVDTSDALELIVSDW